MMTMIWHDKRLYIEKEERRRIKKKRNDDLKQVVEEQNQSSVGVIKKPNLSLRSVSFFSSLSFFFFSSCSSLQISTLIHGSSDFFRFFTNHLCTTRLLFTLKSLLHKKNERKETEGKIAKCDTLNSSFVLSLEWPKCSIKQRLRDSM